MCYVSILYFFLFFCFFVFFCFFFYCLSVFFFFFFFSSRRRHTRWTGDWSSDVCSSDLGADHRTPGDRIVAFALSHIGLDQVDDCLRAQASGRRLRIVAAEILRQSIAPLLGRIRDRQQIDAISVLHDGALKQPAGPRRDELSTDGICTCLFTEDRDVQRIAAECRNVPLYPAKRGLLVGDSEIAGEAIWRLCVERQMGEKAEHA